MKNSMYEPEDLKMHSPGIYDEIFGGSGTQVYLNEEQVFDVLAASTFSDRDKTYESTWVDFIKFKDGTVKIGDIKIVVNDIVSHSVSISDKPIPLDTGSKINQEKF